MIRWIYRSLPGPTPLRIATFTVLVLLFLIALHFIYSWLGDTFLDTGGSIAS